MQAALDGFQELRFIYYFINILKDRTAVDIPKDTILKAVKFKQHVKFSLLPLKPSQKAFLI